MICVDGATSTRLSISPLWIVIEVWRKVDPPIFTVGRFVGVAVSTIAQAPNRIVSRPNRVTPTTILLYIRVPFKCSSQIFQLAGSLSYL
jgi:hypothetical protein